MSLKILKSTANWTLAINDKGEKRFYKRVNGKLESVKDQTQAKSLFEAEEAKPDGKKITMKGHNSGRYRVVHDNGNVDYYAADGTLINEDAFMRGEKVEKNEQGKFVELEHKTVRSSKTGRYYTVDKSGKKRFYAANGTEITAKHFLEQEKAFIDTNGAVTKYNAGAKINLAMRGIVDFAADMVSERRPVKDKDGNIQFDEEGKPKLERKFSLKRTLTTGAIIGGCILLDALTLGAATPFIAGGFAAYAGYETYKHSKEAYTGKRIVKDENGKEHVIKLSYGERAEAVRSASASGAGAALAATGAVKSGKGFFGKSGQARRAGFKTAFDNKNALARSTKGNVGVNGYIRNYTGAAIENSSLAPVKSYVENTTKVQMAKDAAGAIYRVPAKVVKSFKGKKANPAELEGRQPVNPANPELKPDVISKDASRLKALEDQLKTNENLTPEQRAHIESRIQEIKVENIKNANNVEALEGELKNNPDLTPAERTAMEQRVNELKAEAKAAEQAAKTEKGFEDDIKVKDMNKEKADAMRQKITENNELTDAQKAGLKAKVDVAEQLAELRNAAEADRPAAYDRLIDQFKDNEAALGQIEAELISGKSGLKPYQKAPLFRKLYQAKHEINPQRYANIDAAVNAHTQQMLSEIDGLKTTGEMKKWAKKYKAELEANPEAKAKYQELYDALEAEEAKNPSLIQRVRNKFKSDKAADKPVEQPAEPQGSQTAEQPAAPAEEAPKQSWTQRLRNVFRRNKKAEQPAPTAEPQEIVGKPATSPVYDLSPEFKNVLNDTRLGKFNPKTEGAFNENTLRAIEQDVDALIRKGKTEADFKWIERKLNNVKDNMPETKYNELKAKVQDAAQKEGVLNKATKNEEKPVDEQIENTNQTEARIKNLEEQLENNKDLTPEQRALIENRIRELKGENERFTVPEDQQVVPREEKVAPQEERFTVPENQQVALRDKPITPPEERFVVPKNQQLAPLTKGIDYPIPPDAIKPANVPAAPWLAALGIAGIVQKDRDGQEKAALLTEIQRANSLEELEQIYNRNLDKIDDDVAKVIENKVNDIADKADKAVDDIINRIRNAKSIEELQQIIDEINNSPLGKSLTEEQAARINEAIQKRQEELIAPPEEAEEPAQPVAPPPVSEPEVTEPEAANPETPEADAPAVQEVEDSPENPSRVGGNDDTVGNVQQTEDGTKVDDELDDDVDDDADTGKPSPTQSEINSITKRAQEAKTEDEINDVLKELKRVGRFKGRKNLRRFLKNKRRVLNTEPQTKKYEKYENRVEKYGAKIVEKAETADENYNKKAQKKGGPSIFDN